MTGPRHADRPSHTEGWSAGAGAAPPAESAGLNPDAMEVAPGTVHEAVQGWTVAFSSMGSEEEQRVALEKAFDYRGDVTLTLNDGSIVQTLFHDCLVSFLLPANFKTRFLASLKIKGPAKQRIEATGQLLGD